MYVESVVVALLALSMALVDPGSLKNDITERKKNCQMAVLS